MGEVTSLKEHIERREANIGLEDQCRYSLELRDRLSDVVTDYYNKLTVTTTLGVLRVLEYEIIRTCEANRE